MKEINLICSGPTINKLNQKEINFINNNQNVFINRSGFINKDIKIKKDDIIFIQDIIPLYQEQFWQHKTGKVDYILAMPLEGAKIIAETYNIDFYKLQNKTIIYNYKSYGETTSAIALQYLIDNRFDKINIFGLDMRGKGFSVDLKRRNFNYKQDFFDKNIFFIENKSNQWNKESEIVLRTKSELKCFKYNKIK